MEIKSGIISAKVIAKIIKRLSEITFVLITVSCLVNIITYSGENKMQNMIFIFTANSINAILCLVFWIITDTIEKIRNNNDETM